MKLLIVKSIFCPNEYYTNCFLETINKLNMYFNSLELNYQIDLLLIGWTHTYSKNINDFLSSSKLFFDDIHKIFWSSNYGKYKLFNELQEFVIDKDFDYLFYLDHDIYLEFDNFHIFKKDIFKKDIFELFTEKLSGEIIGIIFFNQKEDCRHQINIYENIEKINSFELCWTDTIASYAAGSFLITTDLFVKLEKFDLISIYGFDDYHLAKRVKQKGFQCVVLKNIFVVHPIDNNIEYNKWKYITIEKIINNKILDYEDSVTESKNFWMKNQV